MSDITTENAAYIGSVIDTDHDSKVLKGIYGTGVLPLNFRIIKAIFAPAADDLPVAIGSYSLYHEDGVTPVVLGEGEMIIMASLADISPLTSGGALTVNVGLALTDGGAVVTSLSGGAIAYTVINTGTCDVPVTTPNVTVGANTFLTATTAGSTMTGGSFQMILLVA
jgi:hypothetical protein